MADKSDSEILCSAIFDMAKQNVDTQAEFSKIVSRHATALSLIQNILIIILFVITNLVIIYAE